MLFAAATDHRYIETGHRLDYTNKPFEALDVIGCDQTALVEQVLSSLARGYAMAERMEESNAWRNPIDLIAILDDAFETLLDDDHHAIASSLLDALLVGAAADELAQAVAYAEALRIAHFPTSNEFSDWDIPLRTITFANAVHLGLKRSQSVELLRAVFDAAMSVYLDHFLSMPPISLPQLGESVDEPTDLLVGLHDLLDEREQVNPAGRLVARYLDAGGDPNQLLAMLGQLLLREDRDFHTIQCIEAAFRQYGELRGTSAGSNVLIAAACYRAAHALTVRSQGQTYEIAARLSRGERLYEG